MTAQRGALPLRADLFKRIAPPLQAHLRDHRLLGHPRGAGDLGVESVEREKRGAQRHGRGHDGGKTVGIGARHLGGAGANIVVFGRISHR